MTESSSGKFGRVGVLYGGNSAERVISLRSGKAVLDALLESGVDAVGVDVQFNSGLFEQLKGLDTAFIALHGRGGEDGLIQSVLEILEIPFSGSRVLASALAMDKIKTKQIWAGAGLPTPAFMTVKSESALESAFDTLGHTIMVKPPKEGSSIGMARVQSKEELARAVGEARRYDDDILLEQWIRGSEFTCAILNGEALPVIRLETPNEFYDFEAKYQSNQTRYLVPCGLPAEKEQELQALSLKAFECLGAQGWGRIDAMLDDAGRFWLLELNTVPGMTDHSLVPMAAKARGLSFPQLVMEIMRGAGKQAR
jgi:D-alanine-D-alanine ligase